MMHQRTETGKLVIGRSEISCEMRRVNASEIRRLNRRLEELNRQEKMATDSYAKTMKRTPKDEVEGSSSTGKLTMTLEEYDAKKNQVRSNGYGHVGKSTSKTPLRMTTSKVFAPDNASRTTAASKASAADGNGSRRQNPSIAIVKGTSLNGHGKKEESQRRSKEANRDGRT